MTQDNRFFFEGVFYDSEVEFYAAASRYSNSELSKISAERILRGVCTDICANLCNPLGGATFLTNGEFQGLCSEMFYDFIKKYREILIEKENAKEGNKDGQ